MRPQSSSLRLCHLLLTSAFLFTSPYRASGRLFGKHSAGPVPLPPAAGDDSVVGLSAAIRASVDTAAPSAGGEPSPSTEASDVSCTYALQLFFLQDVSQSYADDLPNLQQFLPNFFEDVLAEYQNSLFAFGTFSDVPMPDVGWVRYEPHDYCFNLDVDFTQDIQLINTTVSNLDVTSGRDNPEAQLTALHHAAAGHYFLNRENNLPPQSKDVRLIVLSTDAEYHVAGDLATEASLHPAFRNHPVLKHYFPDDLDYTVHPNNGDEHIDCRGHDLEDYPSIDQVSTALIEEEVAVLFLVTEPKKSIYEDLASELAQQGILALVGELQDDSSNIVSALNEGLSEVYRLVCIDTTTTSTTTVTTTTTTTVTTMTTTRDKISTSAPITTEMLAATSAAASDLDGTEGVESTATELDSPGATASTAPADDVTEIKTDDPTKPPTSTHFTTAELAVPQSTANPVASTENVVEGDQNSTGQEIGGGGATSPSDPPQSTPSTAPNATPTSPPDSASTSTSSTTSLRPAGGGVSVGVIAGATAGAAAAVGAGVAAAAYPSMFGSLLGGASSAPPPPLAETEVLNVGESRQFVQEITAEMYAW